jgi:hypothetical protein
LRPAMARMARGSCTGRGHITRPDLTITVRRSAFMAAGDRVGAAAGEGGRCSSLNL